MLALNRFVRGPPQASPVSRSQSQSSKMAPLDYDGNEANVEQPDVPVELPSLERGELAAPTRGRLPQRSRSPNHLQQHVTGLAPDHVSTPDARTTKAFNEARLAFPCNKPPENPDFPYPTTELPK